MPRIAAAPARGRGRRSTARRGIRVVVAGATGYVGSRLVPELLGRGHQVVAAASSDPAPGRFSWGRSVDWVRMPATDPTAVRRAVAGADALVYLVHSLDRGGFTATDARAADVVRGGAEAAGVARIVYLSGLQPPGEAQVSAHLASRRQVEQVLGAGPTPVRVLRAGIVIGAGSTSFEILRQAATLSVLRLDPHWLRARVQPVGIGDVVTALADALTGRPDGTHDLGGPDVLGYGELIDRYCRRAGLVRPRLPAPLLPLGLVAPLAPLASAAPWRTSVALAGSLGVDLVCRPAPYLLAAPTSVDTAIGLALRASVDPAEATTYGGDPYVAAGCDPAWTRPPADRVGLALHIAGQRLRELAAALDQPAGGAKNSRAMPSGSLKETPEP